MGECSSGGGRGGISNRSGPSFPNRGRRIEKLSISTPAAAAGEVASVSSYRITEEPINPLTGAILESVATTTELSTWTSTGNTPLPVKRSVKTTTVQQGITLSVTTLTTTYEALSSASPRRVVANKIWTGAENTGILHEFDEVFQLFPWGEEKVSHRVYPNGKDNGKPVIVRETTWWDVNSSLPYYASVKMRREQHGFLNGSSPAIFATASWSLFWTLPDPDAGNPKGSIQVEMGPWQTNNAVPNPADSLDTLDDLAVSTGNYAVSRTYYRADGQWLRGTRHLANNLVESSEDSDSSLFVDETVSTVSNGRIFVTREESSPDSATDEYLLPLKRWEMREGAVDYPSDSALISRTFWFRQDREPSETAPNNPLLSQPHFSGVRKWKETWSSTRSFPDSNPATLPSSSSFIKTCRMVDRVTGLPVLERRFLSSNEVVPGGSPNNSSDILLEMKLWIYDGLARLKAVKTSAQALSSVDDPNWTILEEWDYSQTATSSTTLHIDSQGVKTETVTDLLGRTVPRHCWPPERPIRTMS